MSESDYTFDDNGQSLLYQILAKNNGTTGTTDTTTGTTTKTTPAYNLSTMTPQQVHEYNSANPGVIPQAELDAYAKTNNLAAPYTQAPTTTTSSPSQTGTMQQPGTYQMPAADTTQYNPATSSKIGTDYYNGVVSSLFDSILNSGQGASALGEIASGTSTTPATTQDEFAKLMEQGTLDRKNAPTQSPNTGQQQGNLNTANDYSLYYSTKDRGIQV